MLCAIPIEIVNRELDAVLYLALHLAKRGLPTLMGDYMVRKWVFQFDAGKPVIYFDQDQSLRDNHRVLDAGGVVFNLNQEGLVLEESKEQANYGRACKSLTKLFAWGEAGRRNIFRQFPEDMQHLVEVTGHPSFDLANERFVPFYKDSDIIAAHGEGYIQINSNFSYANLKMDLSRYLKMLGSMDEWKIYGEKEVQEFVWALHDFQKKLLDEFLALANILAEEFPDRHVIFRPHPMEDRELYLREFRSLSNVFVDNSKSVRNWLASAGHVIHCDCTTGMEAVLMGRSVISYQPVFDEEVGNRILAGMGVAATTPEEVVGAVRAGMMPEEQRQSQINTLTPYLANLKESAASRIADFALSYTSSDKAWLPRPLRLNERLECWRKHLSKLIRSKQPGHNGRKVRYALEKFPPTDVRAVIEKVRRLRQAEPNLPKVKVEQVALNTFLVMPEQG